MEGEGRWSERSGVNGSDPIPTERRRHSVTSGPPHSVQRRIRDRSRALPPVTTPLARPSSAVADALPRAAPLCGRRSLRPGHCRSQPPPPLIAGRCCL